MSSVQPPAAASSSLSGVARQRFWPRAATLLTIAWLGLSAALFPPRRSPPPADRLQSDAGWADEMSCIACHDQGKTFWDTGHARTLHRVHEPVSVALLRTLQDSPAVQKEGTAVSFDGQRVSVRSDDDGFSSEAQLGWCFGSGNHARTWVGTLSDSHGVTDLLEFRWSWYRETEGFDLTPGQLEKPAPGYYTRLGLLFDHPKARRCFGCHASFLPLDSGRIDETHIRAGVTCQRCHGPRAEHVATQGTVQDGFWSRAGQHESVKRCAECHRSAEEQDPATIRPDNPEIARFQPIGLTQSACFLRSSMTCVTCHDPHRPLEAQDSTGIWQCTQCHDPRREDHPHCQAGYVDDCLRCHMPKVDIDRPLQFTDHWIRVRSSEPAP